MPPPHLPRGDVRLKDIEKSVKNKFRWDWLDHEVLIAGSKVKIGDTILKREEAGLAWCSLCCKDIRYASRGRAVIVSHLEKGIHVDEVKAQRENLKIKVDREDGVTGVKRDTHGVTLKDRIAHQEVGNNLLVIRFELNFGTLILLFICVFMPLMYFIFHSTIGYGFSVHCTKVSAVLFGA